MIVKAKHEFTHKEQTVLEGQVLNLPDYEANPLIQAGDVEPLPKSPGSGNVTGDSRGGSRSNPSGN